MRATTTATLALAASLAVCSSAGAQDSAKCPFGQPQQNMTIESKRALATTIAGRARQGAPSSAALEITNKLKLELDAMMLKTAAAGVLGGVVTGAPYSGVTTTEHVQTLADGNRIVSTTVFNVARDSMGRVRREQVDHNGAVTSVMIMDPVANATYLLEPANRTARKAALLVNKSVTLVNKLEGVAAKDRLARQAIETEEQSSGASKAKPPNSTMEAASPSDVRKETLGTKSFDGVLAEGGRTVTTIPAGQIGNQQPIEIVAEHWYSMDLKLTVMTRHLDPRTGETTFSVSNLRRGEVDPIQFQVPADYTVVAGPSALKPVIK